jgi:Holliday junction resolvase
MRYLRKKGYYCIRAYGSKGLYDVIAVQPKVLHEGGKKYINLMRVRPLLIQAKYNGYVPKEETKKLTENDKWEGQTLIAYSDKKTHKLKFKSLKSVECRV